MTPIYENYRSETPVYFHYATGSKNYEISLFGLKLLVTAVCAIQLDSFVNNLQSQTWASASVGKTGISPIEIGSKNQKFLENLDSPTSFWLIG